uniref:C-type lectin domain-containing protein n=1 Tax=Amphilophus citrinellus TaxID=61819 RepID=A0A3Q0RQZ0_AMPCI
MFPIFVKKKKKKKTLQLKISGIFFLLYYSKLVAALTLAVTVSDINVVHYPFYYVNLQMNWTDAQTYCREKYTDLATIESMEDISRLNRPPLSTSTAWIGLRDDPEAWKGPLKNDTNSWKWSATGASKTGYDAWAPGQPDNYLSIEYCGMMYADGRWADVSCGLVNPFVFIRQLLNAVGCTQRKGA